MTQVQAPPGRTAAVPAVPADRPVAPVDRRRRGRLGPVVVGQLVVLECAALAVWLATGGPGWLLGLVGVLALLAVGAAFARRGGRWWYEDLMLRRRLRRRRERSRGAAPAGDPRLAALAPELTVVELTERNTRLGIGQDDRGWFAAVALTGRSGAPAGSVEAAVVDRALAVLADFTGPVTQAQVVSHTLVWYPAPGAPPAAHRTVWVALRLSVSDARAETVSRGGGMRGVHRTVAAGIGRLGKALNAAVSATGSSAGTSCTRRWSPRPGWTWRRSLPRRAGPACAGAAGPSAAWPCGCGRTGRSARWSTR
ncbi:type VII secretion protein EccE [Micromonospora sp. ATA51]|uniref:type VII secretion protein EccE n=1 Tax=Micromonospora sp. ATA51 TaxID=2806098 RepID=UPI001EE3EF28|nr:type VII secretion protein EccE [Micromonospora sp. ATA51]